MVEKKDGTKRVVQDFRSLNANTYVDKYSMKDVQECISEIGRAGSTIFTTLDLTLGFWQMALHGIHGARHGAIRVEGGIHGARLCPLHLSTSSGASG
jgi:hypothetical protein